MKKKHIIFLLIVFFIVLFSRTAGCKAEEIRPTGSSAPDGNTVVKTVWEKKNGNIEVLNLPAGLELIGEEAFEGTAFASINIPENVKEIENRAFAGNRELLIAYVYSETVLIRENAFDEDDGLILSGFADSYIQHWAKKRNIRFVLREQFRKQKENAFIAFIPVKKDKESRICVEDRMARCNGDYTKINRNAFRTSNELKASCYTGSLSVYVQSRYFP